jgi:lipoprotein-anchoring transpeptidase ErfK/SrfK
VALALMAVPCGAAAQRQEAVRLQGLTLMQGPDGASARLRALRAGESVTVTGRQGDYVAVTLADGTSGYVHGGFLTGHADIIPIAAYAGRIDPGVVSPGASANQAGPARDTAGQASPGKHAPKDTADQASAAQKPALEAPAKVEKTAAPARLAAPAPLAAYVPVADGGGLDRFLATLAPSQTAGAPVAPEDAAAYNAQKNRYSIEVHLSQRKLFLYENLPDGSRHLARSYIVAVPGRDMEAPQGWGVVTGISFEPSWRPTPAMKERALKKGKPLPEYVGPGVKDNPMGPFKIILSHGYGFRIHGNNNPNSIGRPVTSGCIRMRNDEGKDMAKMIDVGTEVVFLD